jgi:tubulin-specific chaperone A|uniref:Tubulin-specific chaperone A n=1 Tax=Eutreptiella gymnastica TaxID=73025 RepID=A0A7S4G5U4_9EUGL|mmetsp:Transcript_69432/g.115775  ORF Transcript_69432/g.115775 Transcript_69432/m.115775 type:complete len:113 (+) Transcript_69432:32-370(+)|eukprot:CAMPEP_0174302512 /NCGR_PEP_ID=MMETSP0809-20121228/59670_1 /TAXON_ID=73025 ORGANISM="Eutreptiella gymnastica-like, Strain CCMP1594" /NCGR_SAMPLE_ID=MMETSP0809 /ASSEMBLY_ACC=CAM_ASM_000658 /LENGTH=112 /DNA_ID=CAMNT_0015408429 /DNA_START=34 /DNA_END=372 /DNA_ORIENTATION=+
MSAVVKQLKIKTGTLKRNIKDLEMAKKEAARELERMEKFKAENKSDTDLKQQQNCIDEAEQMIPDAKRRIAKAYDDLKQLMDKSKDEADVTGTEEFTAAQAMLTEAEAVQQS